jgi:hypothetical protein
MHAFSIGLSVAYRREDGRLAQVARWGPRVARRERLRKAEASDLCHLPDFESAKINYDIVGVHHVKWRR